MMSSARCCLLTSMRAVNLFVNVCGVVVIIYSLWLMKKWQIGVSELPLVPPLVPRPWFVYTCLGVGIAVCLSTLCGHMVANSLGNYALFIYIVAIFFILCCEVALIVRIFYKIDWDLELAKYIDEHHAHFKKFLMFHVNMCRVIVILLLIPQIKITILATILWAIGPDPRSNCNYSEVTNTNFRYSFLAAPTQSVLDISRHGFSNYDVSSIDQFEYPRPSLLSRVKRVFRVLFHRRVTLS